MIIKKRRKLKGKSKKALITSLKMSFPPMSELEIAEVDDVAYLTCDGTRAHKKIAGCSSFCHCGLGEFIFYFKINFKI